MGPPPRFPLADWIDSHAALPHQLGSSGMRGQLRSTARLLRRPSAASESEVRAFFGEFNGVDPEAVYLTHGATEANALALFAIHRQLHRERGRAPRAFLRYPEYPPLGDAAEFAGFATTAAPKESDVVILSNPNNPTSELRDWDDLKVEIGSERVALVDETFRGFGNARSFAAAGTPGVWVTGTLTKAFGADDVRVGFVIPPVESREEFGHAWGLLTDGISPTSLAAAAALLRNAESVLAETRGILAGNLRALRSKVRLEADPYGPLWFDRGSGGIDSEALARFAVSRGVLVCPGTFFGDPTGVRVGLTRRDFDRDLEAYLEARSAFLSGIG
ncbi:MAG TPA: aminotransferase class I/II-fold pyridoxal phosphate-dependent enzyme [Thermoplasmata archaeon]|nr:aminotransferase class I/II-fold pyridoxal phosphate-dependent enzyme [Thermoplasmata archaeon]